MAASPSRNVSEFIQLARLSAKGTWISGHGFREQKFSVSEHLTMCSPNAATSSGAQSSRGWNWDKFDGRDKTSTEIVNDYIGIVFSTFSKLKQTLGVLFLDDIQ